MINAICTENQEKAIESLLSLTLTKGIGADDILRLLGEYYSADRAYIFENSEDGQTTSNTYEWCAEGVSHKLENLQNIPREVNSRWNELLMTEGSFSIKIDEEFRKKEPKSCEVLEALGIKSVMAASFIVDSESVGFIGLDNVRKNNNHSLLLTVAASSLCKEITVAREKEKIGKMAREQLGQLQLVNTLCRNYLNAFIINLNENRAVILKLDGYVTEGMTKKVSSEYPYDVMAHRYIEDRVIPEDREMMKQVLDCRNIEAKLAEADEFTGIYRVNDNGIRFYQYKFARIQGRSEIIAGFQNVDELVSTELEQKQELSEAYGMIEGLSREYHTICVADKISRRTRMVRSSGRNTLSLGTQIGAELPQFDDAFEKYIDLCVDPEDRERMHSAVSFSEILRKLDEEGYYSVNYLRKDNSGKVGYHQIAFVNADTSDGKKQFVYGFRDVDRLVREERAKTKELLEAKQEAEAANLAKSVFLNNMSHDIRTPMNAILGFAKLMEKHIQSPEKLEYYLSKIEQSGEYLLSILNNVLDIARIESGKTELSEEPVDILTNTSHIDNIFLGDIEKKKIIFLPTMNVTHRFIMADRGKISQIMANLLSNAVKYTPEGGTIFLDFSEFPCEKEGCGTYITTVRDTGIGMSSEYMEHVFEAFSRERNTTESKIGGTGLGLAIVKKLVDLMGGSIEVESEVGKGTAFRITNTHRFAVQPDTSDIAAEKSVREEFVSEGKRLLIAEDNDLNAEIAETILNDAGFITERASDGFVALEMMKSADPDYYDLILMDIQMPGMDGYTATQAIRSLPDKVKANIPIIAMTANAFDEDKKKAIEAGMNGHVAKPIEVSVLMQTLAEVFNKGALQ